MENNYLQVISTINFKTPELWREFLDWIEETPLFRAISQHAGTGLIIDVIPANLQLNLSNNVKVEKAEEFTNRTYTTLLY